METAFLVLIALSAATGFLLRNIVGPRLSHGFLAFGIVALIVGLGVLALIIAGWSPVNLWTGGLVSVLLLVAAAITLPFGLAATCRRR